jgi:hypothetical protein
MDESWRAQLPEQMQTAPSLLKFESPAALAQSYLELEAYRGSSLRIPGPDASAGDQQEFVTKLMEKVPSLVRKPTDDDPESVDNFWKGMGRPDSADEYAAIDGMDENQTEFMRKAALEANLTNAQYRKLAEKMAGKATVERDEANFANQAKMQELEKQWGLSKSEKLQAINLLAGQLEMPESLRENMGDNPDVLAFMDKLVAKIGSEGAVMQQQVGENGSAVMTPIEAELKINEIMGNREHDFWNPASPGHGSAKRYMIELAKYADPGAGTSMESQRAGYSG